MKTLVIGSCLLFICFLSCAGNLSADDLAATQNEKILTTISGSASYLQYTDPWNLRNIESLAVTGGMIWPAGVEAWVGATYSKTILRYEAEDFWQISPVVGLEYRDLRWSAGASGAWLFSNGNEVDSAKVGTFHGGYDWRLVGAGLCGSATFYPSFAVYQLDPRVEFHPNLRIAVGAGPEFQLVGKHRFEGPSPGQKDAEALWSGHFYARWLALDPLTIFASGFAGRRRYAVDLEGLSIWTNNDLFAGGYDIGADIKAGRHLGIFLDFQHRFGIEQEYNTHRFSLLGGTIGLHTTF